MNVKNILSGLASPLRWKRPAQAIAPAAREPAETPVGKDGSAAAGIAAHREIVSRYNLADISPRSFSEMLQKLHDAGALNDAEFQDLSTIRLDLDQEGIGSDKSINLLEAYANRLKNLREEQDMQSPAASRAARQSTLAAVERRLGWLQKVAMIQSPQGAVGLDRTA